MPGDNAGLVRDFRPDVPTRLARMTVNRCLAPSTRPESNSGACATVAPGAAEAPPNPRGAHAYLLLATAAIALTVITATVALWAQRRSAAPADPVSTSADVLSLPENPEPRRLECVRGITGTFSPVPWFRTSFRAYERRWLRQARMARWDSARPFGRTGHRLQYEWCANFPALRASRRAAGLRQRGGIAPVVLWFASQCPVAAGGLVARRTADPR